MSELLAPARAREQIVECCTPLDGETIPADDALGRTLASDLISQHDVPAFDNSAMDGYAVRAVDTRGANDTETVWLELMGESRAGAPANVELGDRQAIEISTGAMLPAGADAVVRVEDTVAEDGRVGVQAEVAPAAEIRRAGEDVKAGTLVLEAGTRLGPAELAAACSLGHERLRCARRPRLASIATGDELVPAGEQLGPGQIHNSNAVAIPAQARQASAELVSVETVGDSYDDTVAAIERALEADLLVLTGGVSVGPHDHVKPALEALAVEQVFWGVALRPGKPTWFGVQRDRGTLVFGLPGNPVSAMVTFHLFVEPALAALAGRADESTLVGASFDADYEKKPGRMHVLRCSVESRDDGLHVKPTKAQGSHVLTSMLGAQALAYLEVERGDVRAGERVQVELLV